LNPVNYVSVEGAAILNFARTDFYLYI